MDIAHHSAEVSFLYLSTYLFLDQLPLVLYAGLTLARFWVATQPVATLPPPVSLHHGCATSSHSDLY